MAAQRFRPCSAHRPNDAHLVQLNRLDSTGPLHPDFESARWPICDPFDAIDALDLSQPVGFPWGVLALLTNEDREVLVALAVRHAPPDDLIPIVQAVIEAQRPGDDGATVPINGVVLGIIREKSPEATIAPTRHPKSTGTATAATHATPTTTATATATATPTTTPVAYPTPNPTAYPTPNPTAMELEEQHWRIAAYELSDHGIELIDVLSIDESGWSSIALTSGELRYPDVLDCRLRWYEVERG